MPLNAPLGETAKEAFANILVQGRRSALALLGILIGTAAIVSMLTIGHMAQQETLGLFKRMGVDMLAVQAAPATEAPVWLDRQVVETLPRTTAAVQAATPVAVGRATVSHGAIDAELSVIGATASLADLAGLEIDRGRFLAAVDDGAMVAVAGRGAATKLSVPGGAIAPGAVVRIGSYAFTIVGTLRANPATGLDPVDYADAIILPLGSSRRVIENVNPNVALVRLRPLADPVAATAAVVARLQTPNAAIQVQTARDLIGTMNAEKAVHSRLLSAIGAISLLVGGIGVMNVMLMGVLERRAEIGLRAAIGASPRDLQAMFVIESGALALAGGVVGAIAGVAIAYGVAVTSGWGFGLPLYVVPFGAGTAALVGLAFGVYPAITASRLDPIEALRAG